MARCTAAAVAWLVTACGSGDADHPFGLQLPDAQAPAAAAVCSADLSGLVKFVYVRPDGSDAPGCGTTTSGACRSIQQGIDACTASGCGVLVRHGLYPTSATIKLRDAVNVYGGCRFDDEPDRPYRSTIQANPAAGTPAIRADSIATKTLVSGLVVIGKDETAAGTASLAMVISDSNGLVLSQMVLVSGRGGDGAPGATPGQAGSGDPGGDAVTTNFGSNGQGRGNSSCQGLSTGGRGGDGAPWRENSLSGPCITNCNCSPSGGASGSSGETSGRANGGAGGRPGNAGRGCASSPGGDASPGGPGSPGSPGQCGGAGGKANSGIWGNLTGAGLTPQAGGAGHTGTVGSGGGGGGAGGVCAHGAAFQWYPRWGQPGGGGGGGGCAGGAGTGGQQGGASIALVLLDSAATWNSQNSLISGPGGRGGNGGKGGAGGPGGGGGSGGNHSVCGEEQALGWGGKGGPGGAGGQGGAGSGGAGGNGGASIGVALRAASIAPAAAIVYPPAPGGAGGSHGGGGQNAAEPVVDPNPCRGEDGEDGQQGGSIAVQDFDRLPLYPGQQLPKGRGLLSPNGNVQLNMQDDDNLCLYSSGRETWCSFTTNKTGIPAALMQTDGNLCMYPTDTSGPWCSGTQGHPGAYLIVQDSGHVQVVDVDGATPLWTRP